MHVSVEAGGGPAGRAHRGLLIVLQRTASSVTVGVGAPLLRAAGGLVRRVKRHRPGTVRLLLVVTQLRGITTRLPQMIVPS